LDDESSRFKKAVNEWPDACNAWPVICLGESIDKIVINMKEEVVYLCEIQSKPGKKTRAKFD
jgi:hypothetical protein